MLGKRAMSRGLLLLLPCCIYSMSGAAAADSHRASSKHEEDDLVHIWVVPHTHDDVGWLSTVDEYYLTEVQWILDTGIQCMADSPYYGTNRRYSYVEMAYLYRWWNERPEPVRQRVRDIIRAGQLELNLAGWCMNDEATTFYGDVIDQMTEGALFVKDEIGDFAAPRVGWHIDPFGHSSATASMWADIGFEAFGLNRINFLDKEARKNSRELEFVWRGSKSRGASSDIFVHVLADGYQTPPEMSVDTIALVPQDDPTLPTAPVNIADLALDVVHAAQFRRDFYLHNNILLPFGNDFDHQNAYKSFQQMDKIVQHINANNTLPATIRYATFSEYIEHLNTLNVTWPTYEGDFFPYMSGHMQYWTGFYTSRPHLKGLVRSTSAVLRVAELLYYSAEKTRPGRLGRDALRRLGIMRRAMATLQHHDAVSGTERQAVAEDYELQLQQGLDACHGLIQHALDAIRGDAAAAAEDESEPLSAADLGNESSVVTLYNSLAWPVDNVVALAINGTGYEVLSEQGERFASQQIVATPEYSKDYATARYKIYFRPGVIPPLGFITVTLRRNSQSTTVVSTARTVSAGEDTAISNDYYKVYFNATSHELHSMTSLSGKSVALNHEFSQYLGAFAEQIKSGAYIFLPQPGNRVFFPPSLNLMTASLEWKFLAGPYEPASEAVPWPLVLASAHMPTFVIVQSATCVVTTMRTTATGTTMTMYRVDDPLIPPAVPPPVPVGPVGPVIVHEVIAGDYLVLEDVGPLGEVDGKWHAGTAPVSNSSSWCSSVTVRFPSAFASPPLVLASTEERSPRPAEASAAFAPAFTVNLGGVSTTSASFNVCRADHKANPTPWQNSVYVNWLAIDRLARLPATQLMGTTPQAASPVQGSIVQVTVDFPSGYSVFEPSIIVTVQAKGARAFAASTAMISQDGFVANISPLEGGMVSWLAEDVTVSWYAFAREDIQGAVNGTAPAIEVVDGPVVSEIRQSYRDRYAITTRLYHGDSDDLRMVEREYDVGTLDLGRELVTRFRTGLATDTCYTDDNGLEMLNRTFDPTQEEPISGNYFPMVKAIEVRDNDEGQPEYRLGIMSDRSHGFGCLGNGMFEIMLQRRCVDDDGCGLNEPLNEVTPIQPKLWMLFEDAKLAVSLRQKLSLLLQYPIHAVHEPSPVRMQSFSLLQKPFPPSVHLLSLKVRNGTQDPAMFVMRVENLNEIDDPGAAPSASLAVNGTFAGETCPSPREELNLTADRLKSAIKRLHWKTIRTNASTGVDDVASDTTGQQGTRADSIALGPREIRTYLVT